MRSVRTAWASAATPWRAASMLRPISPHVTIAVVDEFRGRVVPYHELCPLTVRVVH